MTVDSTAQGRNRQRRRNQPTLRPDRVRRVLDLIEVSPAGWNQGSYASQIMATLCFAGHAVVCAGVSPQGLLRRDDNGHALRAQARAWLGLSTEQANSLFFYGHNFREHPTVEQLKQHVALTTGLTL